MANRARVQKAPPGRYARREYLDMQEAMDYLGIKRSTLQNHINKLNLQVHKFTTSKKHFLSIESVKRIEEVIEFPWKGEREEVKAS